MNQSAQIFHHKKVWETDQTKAWLQKQQTFFIKPAEHNIYFISAYISILAFDCLMLFIMICNSNIFWGGGESVTVSRGEWLIHMLFIVTLRAPKYEGLILNQVQLLHSRAPESIPCSLYPSQKYSWIPITEIISLILENYLNNNFNNFVLIRAWQNTCRAGQLFPWSPWREMSSSGIKVPFSCGGVGKVWARQLHPEWTKRNHRKLSHFHM